MKTNQCKKCGGNSKPSKGIMNFHNIQTSGRSKEFETKLLDCIKCESCGHSWIPETSEGYGIENSPNQRLLSTREQALAWWKQLCLSCELDDTHYVLDNLMRRHIGFERRYHSLTGREIEHIWKSELSLEEKEHYYGIYKYTSKDMTNEIDEIERGIKITKVNQKQFQTFNEDLFKAYIDKFSNEDKLKMLAKLSCEISTVNPILNDLLNRISCYGGNK